MIRDAGLEVALTNHVRRAFTDGEARDWRRHMRRQWDWPDIPQLALALCLIPLLRLFQEGRYGLDSVCGTWGGHATVGALGMTAAAIWLAGWLRGRITSRDIGYVAYFPFGDECYVRTQMRRMFSRGLCVLGVVTIVALPFGGPDLLVTTSVGLIECALVAFTALVLYHSVPRIASEKTGFVLIGLACLLVPVLWVDPMPWLLAVLPAGWPLVLVPQMTDFSPPVASIAGAACVAAALSVPWLYARALARFYIYELHLQTAADPAPGVAAAWASTAPGPAASLQDIAERIRASRRRQQQILEPTMAAQLRVALRDQSGSRGLIERLVERTLTEHQRAAMTFVTGGSTAWTRRWFLAALAAALGVGICGLFPNSVRGECWTTGDTVLEQGGLCVALLILGAGYFSAVWMPGWPGLSTPTNSQGMPMFSIYPVDFRGMAGVLWRTVLIRSVFWLPLGLVQVSAVFSHFDARPETVVLGAALVWVWQVALLPAIVACMVGNAGTRQTMQDVIIGLLSFVVWLGWLAASLTILGPVLALIPTLFISLMIWGTSRIYNDTRADFVQRFRRE